MEASQRLVLHCARPWPRPLIVSNLHAYQTIALFRVRVLATINYGERRSLVMKVSPHVVQQHNAIFLDLYFTPRTVLQIIGG